MKMDNALADEPASSDDDDRTSKLEPLIEDMRKMREDFRSRLIVANLRTEATRAGMVDLDGLKLIDLTEAQLGPDDTVVGAGKIMADLRRNKPWLFGAASSSSVAEAPPAQPVRHKTALEMTDEEYLAARTAIIKRRY